MDRGHKESTSNGNKVTCNLAIFWDIETCPYPKGYTNGNLIAANVSNAVGRHVEGRVAEFCAYGNFSLWPKPHLNMGNVTFFNAPYWRTCIIADICLSFNKSPNSAPWTILLISADADLVAALLMFGKISTSKRKGNNVALAACPGARVSKKIFDFGLGLEIWDWPSLAMGKGVVLGTEVFLDQSCNRDF